jgi:hypothetical protein
MVRVTRTASSTRLFVVWGEAPRSEGRIIPARAYEPSASKGEIAQVCIRQGSTGIVQALELDALGQTVYFSMPEDKEIYGQETNGKGSTLRAEGPKSIVRVPVAIAGR